jgi:hypothetical protein
MKHTVLMALGFAVVGALGLTAARAAEINTLTDE